MGIHRNGRTYFPCDLRGLYQVAAKYTTLMIAGICDQA